MSFNEDVLERVFQRLENLNYIPPEDVPNIDLYMDQILSFFDSELEETKRYADDKMLTKTMINNYTKNNLLPPPVKKKYSHDHMILLIYIYYLKNILSIKDIETLLTPLTHQFFNTKDEFDLHDIYNEIVNLEKDRIPFIKEELLKTYDITQETFHDAPDSKRNYLQLFAFICNLSFDVYLKKQILEGIIDTMAEINAQSAGKEKDKKNKNSR